MSDPIDLNETANELLKRTHEYCVDYSLEQMTLLKSHINKLHSQLEKTVSTNDIAKISASLKTLTDLYNSLQERSVIAFMAQYKPLSNLIENSNPSTQSVENNEVPASNNEDSKIDIVDDFDINDVYKHYED